MAFDFSDEFFPTALSAGLSASTSDNVVQVDTLPSAFVTEVQNTDSPAFPLRIGRGQSQERVLVTGIADAATNKLDVERNVEFGLKSHLVGTRVAHALPASVAQGAEAIRRSLPEPWSVKDVAEATSHEGVTIGELSTTAPFEDAAGVTSQPAFWLDFERLPVIPNALQSNHVRSSVATRWDANGDLVEVAAGEPRLQRDPATGDVLGLLYEPKRTQLLSAPMDAKDAAWSQPNVNITNNVGTAKGQSYARITEDGTDAFHGIKQSISASDGDPVSFSEIVKDDGAQYIWFQVLTQDAGQTEVWFDLVSGTAGTTIAGDSTVIDHSIDDLGGGWYRCNLSAVPAASDNQFTEARFRLDNADGNGGTYSRSQSILWMQAQAEISREVTSPILQGGRVREADEVNYSFSFPDKETGVAYSIEQQSGGAPYAGNNIIFGATSDIASRDHGVLFDGGSNSSKGLNADPTDGYKNVTRNSRGAASDGTLPLDDTIDRFSVSIFDPNKTGSRVFTIRQIAIHTAPHTSQQLSDLESNYLTTP